MDRFFYSPRLAQDVKKGWTLGPFPLKMLEEKEREQRPYKEGAQGGLARRARKAGA